MTLTPSKHTHTHGQLVFFLLLVTSRNVCLVNIDLFARSFFVQTSRFLSNPSTHTQLNSQKRFDEISESGSLTCDVGMSNQFYTFLPLNKSSFFSFYDLFDISQLFVFFKKFIFYLFSFWSVLFELDKGKEEFLSLVF